MPQLSRQKGRDKKGGKPGELQFNTTILRGVVWGGMLRVVAL